MPLILRDATEADLPAIGPVLSAAFHGDAISSGLFPERLAQWQPAAEGGPAVRIDEETPWRQQRFGLRMAKPGMVTMVVEEVGEATASGPAHGVVVGVAQWARPCGPPPPPMDEPAAAAGEAVPSAAGEPADKEKEESRAEAAADAQASQPPAPAQDEHPKSLDTEALKSFAAVMEEANARVFRNEHRQEMWYLIILAVDPAHQRRGVGTLLLDWGLARATQDKRDCYLESTPAGRQFYLNKGFEEVAELVLLGGMHWQMVKREREVVIPYGNWPPA